jgi:glycosyltransferase involved in cell wall biosynthesis
MSSPTLKKILLATDIFPPEIGGPASFIPDLAQELRAANYDVSVVCPSTTATHSSDAERSYPVHRIPPIRTRLHQHWIFANVLFRVAQHDLIFCNTLENYVRPACRLLDRSYVLKIVGDSAWEIARNTGQTDLSIDDFQKAVLPDLITYHVRKRNLAVQQARVVITPSEYLRKMVISWGCNPNHVVTVLNGIRLTEFESKEPRHRSSKELHLVFVGRLVSWKGLDHVLAALEGLTDVDLTIIGNGPEKENLMAQAKSLSVHAIFKGLMNREETLEYIYQANMLILPSNYEGLSHTLLEACASGVVCITSDRGGNPEVITNGVNGLIVPYGDIHGLREAIIRLRDDEDERFRLCVAAKQRSKAFDFQNTLEQTMKILLPASSQPIKWR